MHVPAPELSTPARPPVPDPRRLLLQNAATFVAYVLAAAIGLELARLHANVSPLWPASGVGLAALVCLGLRAWPGLAAGAFVINACTDVGVVAAAAIALGNTLEAILGRRLVAVVERRQHALGPFTRPSSFLVAGVVAPVVSALCGSTTLVVTGSAAPADWATLGLTWWVGDTLGALVLAPLLLALAQDWPRWRRPRWRPTLDGAAIAAVGASTCALLFRPGGSASLHFLAFPVVLVAAARFGRSGALLAAATAAGFAVVGTVDAGGLAASAHERLLLLEVFLGALVVTALYLGEFLRAQRSALPITVMLGGWALGGWLFASLEQSALRLDHQRFEEVAHDAEQRIRQRVTTYVDALRAGVSLHAASQVVERDEWRRFAASLDLVRRYPGIRGIGVVAPVRTAERDDFVAAERVTVPAFAVHSVPGATPPIAAPDEPEHFVIRYLEPLADNERALGLDLGSEASRRTAACAARDTGEPWITDRITLVQDDERRPGFLLYVPLYARGAPTTTVAERRRALVAWIYAPVVTETFLEGVLGSHAVDLGLHFYRDADTSAANLVYSSSARPPGASFEVVTTMDLCGRRVTLGWQRAAGFVATAQGVNMLTGASLALLALLTAGFIHNLQTLRQRACDLAIARTRELEEANQRLAEQMRERDRAELEARQARHAAEVASRSKSDFLATMSHEIRTPLNSVLGFTELLRQSALTGEQQEWATCIQTAGRTLLSLIDDVLDFSKIEAGKMRLESIPFAPVGIAESVVAMLRPKAAEHGLQLLLEIESAPNGPVVGDPNRCVQVLLNLTANAVKFTAAGSVRVRMRCAPLAPGRVLLRVEVEDTGIGVAPDKLATLFREFTQADASTTRRFGGTGLGLAICKRLVELMGGTIGAVSTVGAGSTFWFELPLPVLEPVATDAVRPVVPAARRPALLVRTRPGTSSPARILVAEDVAMNQALIRAMLARSKCHVEFAADGGEAVAMCERGAFDLVLMDCQMPEVDGFEATRRIRSHEHAARLPRTPIVALTANVLEGDRVRCLEAGMDDYLTKPIRFDDFHRVLAHWLEH